MNGEIKEENNYSSGWDGWPPWVTIDYEKGKFTTKDDWRWQGTGWAGLPGDPTTTGDSSCDPSLDPYAQCAHRQLVGQTGYRTLCYK